MFFFVLRGHIYLDFGVSTLDSHSFGVEKLGLHSNFLLHFLVVFSDYFEGFLHTLISIGKCSNPKLPFLLISWKKTQLPIIKFYEKRVWEFLRTVTSNLILDFCFRNPKALDLFEMIFLLWFCIILIMLDFNAILFKTHLKKPPWKTLSLKELLFLDLFFQVSFENKILKNGLRFFILIIIKMH